MANLVFKDAERARDAVVASQKKEIADLYEKWAKDIEKQAQRYSRSSNASAPVSKAQMRQLLSQVKAAGQQTANEVYNTIKRNMYTVADGTVKCNAKWMEGFGFSKDGVEAAFSYVPTDVVERLITGQVYESGWSLSKSIWGANEATMKDIYEIVAKAEQRTFQCKRWQDSLVSLSALLLPRSGTLDWLQRTLLPVSWSTKGSSASRWITTPSVWHAHWPNIVISRASLQ